MTPNVEFTTGSNKVWKRVPASKKPTIPQTLLDAIKICILFMSCPVYCAHKTLSNLMRG